MTALALVPDLDGPQCDAMDEVTRLCSARVTPRDRVDALIELEAHKAAIDAAQLRLLAAMAAHDPDGRQWAREDAAAALRISPQSAANRMALAESACARFPRMLALLDDGRVTLLHLRKLEELTAHLDVETAAAVEERVLDAAQVRTVGEFGRYVRRAVVRVDADGVERRQERARHDRRVSIRPLADGMAELYWLLPAEQAGQIAALLSADIANPHPGEPRVNDQRRSDALFQRITAGSVGQCSGVTAQVLVTVPATVLSGDSDAPGELDGYGPIPASLARRIAADPASTWKRLVVDESGRLLDYGRTTYRPPADLARHVVARDRTCCFPGCTRPAARCELDHCRDWARGGETNAANLYALCPRHHHLKHEAGWAYHELPDGNIEWVSPTGRRYVRQTVRYDTGSDPPPAERPPSERPPLPDDPPF